MGKNPTHKDLMKRLDDLEKRNTIQAGIYLLYSLAIAFLIGFYSTNNIMFTAIGVLCYFLGIILSIKMAIKKKNKTKNNKKIKKC